MFIDLQTIADRTKSEEFLERKDASVTKRHRGQTAVTFCAVGVAIILKLCGWLNGVNVNLFGVVMSNVKHAKHFWINTRASEFILKTSNLNQSNICKFSPVLLVHKRTSIIVGYRQFD